MEEKERKSKRQEMADEGVLHAQYTLAGWFVKVKPAYGIEKVKFSFVKKAKNENEKGKKAFDVYMDIDTMDNWCDDILDRTFCRIISEENKNGEKYPKYYKFVTGENGALSVGICTSSTGGYCIQGKGSLPEYANVPVSYDWLRTLAKYFKRTSKSKFEDLAINTVKSSNAYFKRDDDACNGEEYVDEKDAPTEKNQGSSSTKQETEEAPKEMAGNGMKASLLFTATQILERKSHKGDFAFTAITKPLLNGKIPDDAQRVNVVVSADVIKGLGNMWDKFMERNSANIAEKNSTEFKCTYVIGTEYIDQKEVEVAYFKGFAK